MEDFYSKTEYNFEDVRLLIDNEVEESIHLDFKEANALDKSDGKRKDISKDVASFANSDGGIIVYGLREENHKAKAITFIDGNEYTKEWLEQVINSSIQRKISELLIFPLRYEGKIEKTVYIVKIPKSLDAPHISRDKKFYKRYNFESVPMEEYEVRQSYGQKLKSKLSISEWSLSLVEKESQYDHYKFNIEVSVSNTGDTVEDSYKTNIYIENYSKFLNISWPEQRTHYNYTLMSKGRVKISSSSIAPIFPNETINTIRFDLTIQKVHFREAFETIKFEVKVLYSNGQDTMNPDMSDFVENVLNKTL